LCCRDGGMQDRRRRYARAIVAYRHRFGDAGICMRVDGWTKGKDAAQPGGAPMIDRTKPHGSARDMLISSTNVPLFGVAVQANS